MQEGKPWAHLWILVEEELVEPVFWHDFAWGEWILCGQGLGAVPMRGMGISTRAAADARQGLQAMILLNDRSYTCPERWWLLVLHTSRFLGV